jgi:hypothetical protein
MMMLGLMNKRRGYDAPRTQATSNRLMEIDASVQLPRASSTTGRV